MSVPVNNLPRSDRGSISVGSRILIGFLLLVAILYGAIVVYHVTHPDSRAAADSFLERCRKTCLKYGLVPTGNLRRDAREYLKAVGADASQSRSGRWKTEPDFVPVASQPHPLLGQPAPEFGLADDRGELRELRTLVGRGPVVVVFYYGFQCSHCVAQLYGLDDDLEQFRELGAGIVALSADPSEETAKKLDQYGRFGFPVLSDPDNRIAELYGVFTRGTDEHDEDLQHGTFLIDRQGTVVWAYRGYEPFVDNATLLKLLAKMRDEVSHD